MSLLRDAVRECLGKEYGEGEAATTIDPRRL